MQGAGASRDPVRVRMYGRLRDRRGGALGEFLSFPAIANGEFPFQDLDLGHGRRDRPARGACT
jgi:hypothetical protein